MKKETRKPKTINSHAGKFPAKNSKLLNMSFTTDRA
jgi:hypothetical protein